MALEFLSLLSAFENSTNVAKYRSILLLFRRSIKIMNKCYKIIEMKTQLHFSSNGPR